MISVTKGPRIKLESSDYRGSNNPQLKLVQFYGNLAWTWNTGWTIGGVQIIPV